MKESILTRVLVNLVNSKIENEEYGVAIINLPSFDYLYLVSKLSTKKKHEVFFLGFSDAEEASIRNEMLGIDNATIAFSVEEAENSRNNGRSDVFRILIIKKAELEKLSSLRWFPEIDMETVYIAACKLVKKELQGSNDVVTALISALGRKNIRNLLGFERVLDYLTCLLAAAPESLPATISEQFYRLGLCMDKRISASKHTTDSFIKLIKENYSIVERIGNLEQSERQSVTNYYTNQDNKKDVPRLILKYYEERDIDILSKLDYSEVQACLQAAKRKPKEPPKPPKAKTNKKPIAVATQLAFNNDEKHVRQLIDDLNEKINNRSDKGKKKQIEVSVDNIKLQVNTNPITEAIAEEVVGEEYDFGGVIKAEVSSPADAIKDKAKYDFIPFKRETYLNGVFEKLEKIQQVLSNDGGKEIEKISLALKKYLSCRDQISKFSMRLQDTPMLQIIAERASFVKYLEAYEALLNTLNDNIAKVYSVSNPTAIDILSAIVSLDNIYVIGNKSKHIVPTVLNPLYLWKYIKLSDEIAASRGVSSTENAYLSEKDKDFIIRKSEDIPDPLSVMPIPETLIPDNAPMFLPISGRLGLLPAYSTVKQVNQSESGIDALKNAIIRYLCLYPHAGMMLKLVIIDPPSVNVIVNMLKMLNNDKDFNIEGIEVSIYRTSKVPADWVEIEDKALNDGMLGTVKGKRSLNYRFNIYDKDNYDYDAIIKDLKNEQHIITVFDPNDVLIQTDSSSKNLHINPLCVPKIFNYDAIESKVEIKPTCEGDVFSVFSNIIERLNNHPSNNMQTSTYFNSPLNDSTYRRILDRADWLIILDQSLRSWDISLQSGSEKLYYKENEYRSIGIYSKNCQKFILGYSNLIKHLGNLVPNKEGLEKVINAVRDTNDDGLLSIVSHTSNRIFDSNQGKGSLGTAIAAIRYQHNNPDALLVGLDTQIAQEWLSNREDGRLPDLIGINLDDDMAEIDIMEVKTYSNDPKAFVVHHDNAIEGHAVEQATVLEGLLHEIFGSSEKLTTISRREILREQVYDCLYQADLSPEEKRSITAKLNDLFSGKYKLNIRKNIVFVAFEESSSYSREYYGTDEYAGNRYLLTAIGSDEIQAIITNGEIRHENDFVAEAQEASANTVNENKVSIGTQAENSSDIVESNENDAPLSAPTDTGAVDDSKQKTVDSQEINPVLKNRCTRLTKAFRDYGIKALPVDESLAQEAARFTRFKVELKSGETVKSIERYKADIARELEANGEILIDHIKGTKYISVDVPFDDGVKTISLIEHLSLLDNQKGMLNIVAGQKPDGVFELLDISKAPHMLVAGTTGSGKTIFLYSIIVSLLHQYSQEDISFLIIDPKQTDFMFFDELKCLYGEHVVTDSEEALEMISRINEVDKEERTALLKSCKSRDIESYNEKNPDNKMKRLIVIIDEYSDLIQASEMNGTRKEFEQGLVMLAQRVRNLGIHLIIATQRPSAQIVTGTLKANVPYRASFRLPSHTDSQTILDMSGAENLLGKGDMLLRTDNDTMRMQGLFISEAELEDFVENL